MTTAAADIEQTQDSAAGLIPPSDERPSPALEETAPPAQDQETPDTDAAQEPEESSAPAQPEAGTPEYYRSLQERVDSGDVLTSQERESLNRHYQSERDREQAQVMARQFTAQQRQALLTKAQTFRKQSFDMFLSRLGYSDPELLGDAEKMRVELLQRDWDQAVADHLADTEPLHMLRWEIALRDGVAGILGQGAQRELAQLDQIGDTSQRLAATIEAYGRAVGQRLVEESDLGKQVKKLTEERDRFKRQIETLKGLRGAGGSGADTRGKDSPPTPPARDRVDSFSAKEAMDFLKAEGVHI